MKARVSQEISLVLGLLLRKPSTLETRFLSFNPFTWLKVSAAFDLIVAMLSSLYVEQSLRVQH